MDIRLREAAQKGDVLYLQSLIKEVPFLLSTISLEGSNKTPLHIACLSVHLEFTKEIIHLRPEFARELNQDGFSPLHIASTNGDIEIVKELLNSMNTRPAVKVLYNCKSCLRQKVGEAAQYFTNQKQGGCLYVW
ncbi:ankyrin repeat-containing protein At3g12360-like [Solanum tuberosum]|uniref:ankyrin repeat-containing protein At3g12360-like n=1 Tax=Solanum tuberosum TaxID=4113 RepID=UPI00073A0BCD|nr:PREDICTED: ankyrin repeat-containing protein At3g12360-like [Solanum tuberosum]